MREFFLSWGPLLVIIVGGILLTRYFYNRQMKTYGNHVDHVEDLNNKTHEVTLQMKASIDRNTEILEDIRSLLQQGNRPN